VESIFKPFGYRDPRDANPEPSKTPSSFFLDSELFSPLASGRLSHCGGLFEKETHSAQMGVDEVVICNQYFTTTHEWFPMLSKRRFLNERLQKNEGNDGCRNLLLLCMKLSTCPPDTEADKPSLYTTIKSLCYMTESGGLVSLRLIQSLILIVLYEMSHAIYPAAYITLGRAARLASLMGLETRNYGKMLFRNADTWTLREEHRRTWWALFIVDRYDKSLLSSEQC
jgi:hypothetical protein